MNLPETSKIWIYQSSRNFNAEEINAIETSLEKFMEEWNAHGAAMTAAYALPYERFIVIAADETRVPASGCSVDSLTQMLKALEDKYQFGFFNHMMVSYGIEEEIFTIPLSEFKQKVRNNEIPMHASIFHNGITNLKDFEEAWELPLDQSWVSALLEKNA